MKEGTDVPSSGPPEGSLKSRGIGELPLPRITPAISLMAGAAIDELQRRVYKIK